jgi:acetyl esterase/lipase
MKRLALSLLLAALCLPAFAQSRGTWTDDCQCFRNAVWGPETWPPSRRQILDYWPASKGATDSPLIIFAHPNGGAGGGSKTIGVDSPMYLKVIVPARAAGYAVASIEYRHPVADGDVVFPTAHDDIALATRWLKARAGLYKFDVRNVFYLGHSRGALVSWTAIHYSADPTVSVNAAYVYQGQATYRGEEIADRFVLPQDRVQFVADYNADNPQHALFGSAAADVTPSAPPLMLKVRDRFFRQPVPADWIGVHHPDNALYLCQVYAAKAPGVPCTAIDQISGDDAYAGFTDFFDRWLWKTPG